jgi:hypothetical protein
MRPEARQAARAQAIQTGKDKKKEAESKKRAEKAKNVVKNQGGNVSKQQARGAPSSVASNVRR